MTTIKTEAEMFSALVGEAEAEEEEQVGKEVEGVVRTAGEETAIPGMTVHIGMTPTGVEKTVRGTKTVSETGETCGTEIVTDGGAVAGQETDRGHRRAPRAGRTTTRRETANQGGGAPRVVIVDCEITSQRTV